MNLLEIKTDFELSEASSPIKHVTSAGGGGQIYIRRPVSRQKPPTTSPTVVRACVVASRSL